MEPRGYTASWWQRPELQRARRWQLVEVGDRKVETAKGEARRLVKFISAQQGETRKGLAAYYASKDLEASKDAILAGDTHHSEEFMKEVRLELDNFGWAELYHQLGVEHEAAKSQAGDAKTCPNVSREDEGHGSRTARACAYLRAAAHACGFGPDPFARLLPGVVSEESLRAIADEFLKSGYTVGCGPKTLEKLKREPWNVMLDSLLFIQTRTCFLDDVTLQFVHSFPTCCNIVLLGAGFDLRFHRLSLPTTARLWEVDTIASQQAKRECVEELVSARTLPGAPSTVHYVPCDFQIQAWLDVLIAAGLCVDVPTVILWEGVCYYLDRDVVMSTLRVLTEHFSAAPAAIAFDYVSPRLLESRRDQTRDFGEPWLFGIEPSEIEEFVCSAGCELKVLDHLSEEECAKRYMPRRADDTSCGAAAAYKCFVMVANSSEQWRD